MQVQSPEHAFNDRISFGDAFFRFLFVLRDVLIVGCLRLSIRSSQTMQVGAFFYLNNVI